MTDGLVRAGLVAGALLLVGATAGWCEQRARAEEAPTVLFVYALAEPALLVPTGFALHAAEVIACESSWQSLAINRASGASGLMQLHPVHRRGMAARGLDYLEERDRLYYAAWVIWPRQGWAPWGVCGPGPEREE